MTHNQGWIFTRMQDTTLLLLASIYKSYLILVTYLTRSLVYIISFFIYCIDIILFQNKHPHKSIIVQIFSKMQKNTQCQKLWIL